MRIRTMIKRGVSACRFQIWTSNWWMTMGRISRDMMSEANSVCEVRRSLKDILKPRKPTLGIGMQRGFFIREILRILMGRQDCIILLIVKRCVFFLPLPLLPSLPTLTPSLLFLFSSIGTHQSPRLPMRPTRTRRRPPGPPRNCRRSNHRRARPASRRR